MHPTLAVQSMQEHHSSLCVYNVLLGLIAGGLSVLVLAYFESSYSRERAVQTPFRHSCSTAFHGSSECKVGCWSSIICPHTVHLQVHYILWSNHQSALSLRQVQGCGCSSTSLCGSACRPAADPPIIITIKHCFPNKTISLPLIPCQSLCLFTSGHPHPGTALTQSKTQAQLNIPLCFVDEMEM